MGLRRISEDDEMRTGLGAGKALAIRSAAAPSEHASWRDWGFLQTMIAHHDLGWWVCWLHHAACRYARRSPTADRITKETSRAICGAMKSEPSEKPQHQRRHSPFDPRCALLQPAQTHWTILGDDRAVFPAIVSNAQTPLSARDQRFGFQRRHRRQVVDIQFALTAKPRAFVADHSVPVRRTRAGDFDVS